MIDAIKQQVLDNSFVDKVRTRMEFDPEEYSRLRTALVALADALKGSPVIDRDLMLCLYAMPMTIRNAYDSFSEHETIPEIAMHLEDAWVELDEMITDCLVD